MPTSPYDFLGNFATAGPLSGSSGGGGSSGSLADLFPGGGLSYYGGGGHSGGGGFQDPLQEKLEDIPGPLGDLFGKAGSAIRGLFGGGNDKPQAPYWQRLAKREIAQGNAALAAYNALYEPTLALARRSSADYGDLYRRASNEALAHEILSAREKRNADIGDFQRLAPGYISGIREANPILGQVYDTATSDLAAGSTLTPEMRREIEQSVRAGQAARGFGQGPVDIYQEAIEKSGYGQQLKQQRIANAMAASGLYGDVFQATTGRPTLSPAPQGSNIAAPAYGDFNNDLFSYGVNREIQGRDLRAAQGARRDALIGSVIQGILGSASKIGGMGI